MKKARQVFNDIWISSPKIEFKTWHCGDYFNRLCDDYSILNVTAFTDILGRRGIILPVREESSKTPAYTVVWAERQPNKGDDCLMMVGLNGIFKVIGWSLSSLFKESPEVAKSASLAAAFIKCRTEGVVFGEPEELLNDYLLSRYGVVDSSLYEELFVALMHTNILKVC